MSDDNMTPEDGHVPDDLDMANEPAHDVLSEAEAIIASAEAEALAERLDLSTVDVAQAVTDRDEYLNSLRRLQADFDNYRKRVAFDQELAADRASQKLIDAMVPVLDTFEMALSHEADPNSSPLAKMHDQLLTALEGQGLIRLHPLDEPFDPEEAEAVMTEAGDGVETGPVVSEVLRAGYRWRGRVIRAAMVKVRE